MEPPINRLKQFRRIATRYAKRASTFAAVITIASISSFQILLQALAFGFPVSTTDASPTTLG